MVAELTCPRCRLPLAREHHRGRETALDRCPRCSGTWLGIGTFESLCHTVERRRELLSDLGERIGADARPDETSSLACARCGRAMRRFNYAGDSGIYLDICGSHGIWFDGDELRRVARYVESGGLAVSLARRDAPPALGLRSYAPSEEFGTLVLVEMVLGFVLDIFF